MQRTKRRIITGIAAAVTLVGLTGVGLAVGQASVEAWPWEYDETGRYGSIEGFERACADVDGRVKRLDRYILVCFADRTYGPWTFEQVELMWNSPLADPNPSYGGGGGAW